MIRPLSTGDLAALVALEADAQSGASAASLARALEDEAMIVLGAWQEKALVGYALLARLPFEAELQAIGVANGQRGQGIGGALLETVLAHARTWQSERTLLEVRASNHSAIRLYEAAGFCVDGRRRNYYSPGAPAAGAPAASDSATGREDALLMSRAP
ncbi:GNAT family N-acetyltransferase [Halomonas sp. GD1P12]|uniref:GNAT family N-acetyltransferase n=1 Tax=Halomonas sp. GD1P12 TaxID=2982691 RepID=UPI0021E4B6DC|nr:GNAT family N-acetyltransferase [Halomonas sp. GD1P12]UYF99469.1 GNAT family N-acetyltransferase [Halomonas sp. GD1P12]